MVHIKDLTKEDYSLYERTMNSIQGSYYTVFWTFMVLLGLIGAGMAISGYTIADIIVAGFCVFILIFNLIVHLKKMSHVKKLFNITKLSLLN